MFHSCLDPPLGNQCHASREQHQANLLYFLGAQVAQLQATCLQAHAAGHHGRENFCLSPLLKKTIDLE